MINNKKNIISFSLWGDDAKYWVGALRNIELARKLYPGWQIRFYIDESFFFKNKVNFKKFDSIK